MMVRRVLLIGSAVLATVCVLAYRAAAIDLLWQGASTLCT